MLFNNSRIHKRRDYLHRPYRTANWGWYLLERNLASDYRSCDEYRNRIDWWDDELIEQEFLLLAARRTWRYCQPRLHAPPC